MKVGRCQAYICVIRTPLAGLPAYSRSIVWGWQQALLERSRVCLLQLHDCKCNIQDVPFSDGNHPNPNVSLFSAFQLCGKTQTHKPDN